MKFDSSVHYNMREEYLNTSTYLIDKYNKMMLLLARKYRGDVTINIVEKDLHSSSLSPHLPSHVYGTLVYYIISNFNYKQSNSPYDCKYDYVVSTINSYSKDFVSCVLSILATTNSLTSHYRLGHNIDAQNMEINNSISKLKQIMIYFNDVYKILNKK